MQTDLAGSLRAIAKDGPDAFYRGEIARADRRRDEGRRRADHDGGPRRNTRPWCAQPVDGTYRGYDIFSMPPPSSGGTHIVEILNILEGYPIGELGFGSAKTMHLMAEAMKRAYADRSEYLGDSDFVDVPVKGLTSKAYAEALSRRRSIAEHATPSADDQARQAAPLRKRPDHAFLRRRQATAMPSPTPTR